MHYCLMHKKITTLLFDAFYCSMDTCRTQYHGGHQCHIWPRPFEVLSWRPQILNNVILNLRPGYMYKMIELVQNMARPTIQCYYDNMWICVHVFPYISRLILLRKILYLYTYKCL